MTIVHLKLKSPTEIRRISIDSASTLPILRESITKLFQGTSLPVNFSIKYEDEEQDKISIVSESDWVEALSFAESRNLSLVLILGEPVEEIVPEVEDEISKLEKEFIFLSAVDIPQAKEVIEQALNGAKDILEVAKEKIQTIIEDSLPKAGNEIQNFFAKQGQNAEEVIQNIQEFVKNAIDEDLSKKLEILSQPNEPVVLGAKLVRDVTITDGTIVNPNVPFLKIWQLTNDGNCSWPEGTQIKPISAIRLSAEPSQLVKPIQAGETIDISVEMIAPTEPGKYRSFYRLFHPDTNTPFGDIFWVDVVVPQPYQFQDQLSNLTEMGYDESLARYLLDEHKGNVEECMSELTNSWCP